MVSLAPSYARMPQLLIDVGSGSIGAAVIVPGDAERPARIRTYRRLALPQAETPRDEKAARMGLVELLKTLVPGVLEAFATQRMGKTPHTVLLLLRAPWVQVSTTHATRSFDAETTITADVMKALAKDALLAAQKLDGEVFEKTVIRAELNGYPTAKPEGKRAHRAHAVILQGAADPAFLTALKDAVLSAAPGRTIEVRSSPHVLMSIVQPLARTTPEFLLVDVTSEVTGFTVVRHGSIDGHDMAAIGWRGLIRSLAEKYRTTPDEALSRLKLAIAESCTNDQCSEVLSSLGDLAPAFITSFAETLTRLSQGGAQRVPMHIVLAAPPEVVQWFSELLSRIDFSQFTTTSHPFAVQQLLAKHVAPTVIFEPGLTPDAGIAMGAAFIHTRAQ